MQRTPLARVFTDARADSHSKLHVLGSPRVHV